METINQPIETYLPIFNGFYGSQWQDPNFEGEAEYYGLPDKFDFSEFFTISEFFTMIFKILVFNYTNN